MVTDAFAADRYVVEQVIRPIANLYRISADGRPVAFVRQKKLAIREDLRFFADESETEELFRIKARSMLDVAGTYDVATPTGERIGALAKAFGASLLRSTWRLLDAEGAETARAQEQNVVVAIVRRVVDVPLPYHFEIRTADGRELGSVRRAMSLRDRYDLDLARDVERLVDRRLAVALGVALDALEGR